MGGLEDVLPRRDRNVTKSDDQPIASMHSLLRGWALQAVLNLTFRFWLSETGKMVTSLGQLFDTIEKNFSLSKEEKCERTDRSRRRGGSVIEEKVESENVPAEGRIKDFLSQNLERNFKLSDIGSHLVRKGRSNQDEAMRNFQNAIDLLHLDEEQVEQLGLGMLGEVNREQQVGMKY